MQNLILPLFKLSSTLEYYLIVWQAVWKSRPHGPSSPLGYVPGLWIQPARLFPRSFPAPRLPRFVRLWCVLFPKNFNVYHVLYF